MKLWLVRRDDRHVGYDEFDGWVIVHNTGEEAMDVSGYRHEKGITAIHVGKALDGYSAGDVVLGSFNAG